MTPTLNPRIRQIALSALVGALYVALTVSTGEIGFGLVQFRFAEALCLLPFYAPETIPGLFLGCVLSNILGSPFAVLDVVFGSLATLIAVLIVSRLKVRWLTPLPVILCNATVVGGILSYFLNQPYWLCFASVGFGELAVCVGLGLPMLYALSRVPYFRQLFPKRFRIEVDS